MNKPETQATLGTEDTEQTQAKQNTQKTQRNQVNKTDSLQRYIINLLYGTITRSTNVPNSTIV